MSTIYTINGKVLKNSANDKWLTKKETPAPSDEVIIGTQTWKSVNLAVNDGGSGITSYNVGVVNGVDLGTQYYYDQTAAVRVANSITGWHLPSKSECETLINYIGSSTAGTKLKSTSGWYNSGNGTDDYGFNALPVGYYTTGFGGGHVEDTGYSICLWTATEGEGILEAYRMYFGSSISNAVIDTGSMPDQYSIRLIKDT